MKSTEVLTTFIIDIIKRSNDLDAFLLNIDNYKISLTLVNLIDNTFNYVLDFTDKSIFMKDDIYIQCLNGVVRFPVYEKN